MSSPEWHARSLRVTALISSLRAGGAERVLTVLSNAWVQRGWSVTVLHFAPADEAPFFALDERVVERRLGLLRVSKHPGDAFTWNIRRMRILRRAIRDSQPDVVLSFTTHMNVLALLATIGLEVPVVVSERGSGNASLLSRPWRLLRTLSYSRSAAVVAFTRAALTEMGWAGRPRGYAIPNPVLPPPSPRIGASDPHLVVAAGRLMSVKGFDLLIEAFGYLAGRNPEWRLEIWGEGPERPRLEALRDALGLSGRVSLPGRTSDVTSTFRPASFFVASSRSEGFGNVLLEAMSCGLPAVSFDCSGPHEIIRHGIDGLLVAPSDTMALASAMESLMTDRHLRETLAARAPDVLERFSLQAVLAEWDAVFRAALAGRLTDAVATQRSR